MADVISGGVSSLPGHKWPLPEGAKCDNHPDRPAVARRQGETDSMGCELNDLCAECDAAVVAYQNTPRNGYCEVHNGEGEDIRPRRDIDEGMSGRLYMTCKSCRKKEDKALAEELVEYEREREARGDRFFSNSVIEDDNDFAGEED